MSDDLVKRLRELRSKQYADPNTAPEFVFLDPDLPPKEWEEQYAMDVIYVRADRIEELEAKLEVAVEALLAFQSFERSAFFGQDADKNKQAVYRGVKRKITKALAAVGVKT